VLPSPCVLDMTDVLRPTQNGNTALHLACNKQCVKAVTLFLSETNKLPDKVKWINTKNRVRMLKHARRLPTPAPPWIDRRWRPLCCIPTPWLYQFYH
jgi:ankyrin repeat protein